MFSIKSDYKRKLKIAKYLDRILNELTNNGITCSGISMDELHTFVDNTFTSVEDDEADTIIEVTLTNKVMAYLINSINGCTRSTIDSVLSNISEKIWTINYEALIDTVIKVSRHGVVVHGISGNGKEKIYPHYLATSIVTKYLANKLTLQTYSKTDMYYTDDDDSAVVTEQNIKAECGNLLNMLSIKS